MKYLTKLLEISRNSPAGILYIEKDEHKTCYKSIREGLTKRSYHDEWLEKNLEEVVRKCEESGESWCVQFYPDSPRSFYISYSSSLEDCCKEICEAMEEQKIFLKESHD